MTGQPLTRVCSQQSGAAQEKWEGWKGLGEGKRGERSEESRKQGGQEGKGRGRGGHKERRWGE